MKERHGLSQIGNNPLWVFWTTVLASVFFVPYLWAMMSLPGLNERACLIGASLTPGNVLFSGIMSVFTALMFFGLWLLHKRRAFRFRMAAGGTVGGIMGFFTVFCTLCTLPVISLFGLSVSLGFFTTYNVMLKTISVSLMVFIVWLLDVKLKDCKVCA